ncbi:imm11 family protein [Roseobacter sp. HKCCA0434]|uniref:imm11 family protein n=1 Tax=Roseobacter sp. HKCCA0434 TaxID=3079297 RepID=UPI0029057E96|nr:DUF1629 domain-containing protein [Roseobacter sp. HKCCA0434]
MLYLFKGSGAFSKKFDVSASRPQARFGFNKPGLDKEQMPVPPFMTHWERYHTHSPDLAMFDPVITVRDIMLAKLPDIFHAPSTCVVSERAKAVIRSLDPFPHQFSPISVTAKKSGEAAADQFYRFQCNVMLRCRMEDPRATHPVNFITGGFDRPLTDIFDCSEIHAYLQDIPIWVYFSSDEAPFFNEPTYRALKAAGLTGIDEFPHMNPFLNTGMETVGRIDPSAAPLRPSVGIVLPNDLSPAERDALTERLMRDPASAAGHVAPMAPDERPKSRRGDIRWFRFLKR